MTIDEKVTVGIVDDSPKYVLWKGRSYTVLKIGLHHTVREGKTLYHIFSVATKTLFLRLKLDTENLTWKLEEISNRLPD